MNLSARLRISRRHRGAEERGLAARSGQRREDRLDVLEEAEVEHLVGLVEHHVAGAVEEQVVAADHVHHAADGADDDLGPPLRRAAWSRIGAPPKTATTSMPALLAVGAQRLRHLDAELARRREHERLDVSGSLGSTYSSIGSPKAAVLPVPVWAWPITSRPSSSAGIACSWIGVGSRSPDGSSASSVGSERPSSAKRGHRRRNA